MKAHLTKTDNASVANKVYLRETATKHLSSLRVLDLYAGQNVLWDHFDKEKYFSVEIQKNKGKNLTADCKRIIGSLDLSKFNVIDCDSYGVPFDVILKLFQNESLQKGTVIIYTAITNKMSGLNKECIKIFGLSVMYKKCITLVAGKALELFYAMLERNGIKEVNYYSTNINFIKHYGYFIVN